MIQIRCPLCGSPVKAAEAKPYSRLSCKKCLTPFHLNKTGTPVVGAPPDVEIEYQEVKQKIQQELAQFPVRKVVIGVSLFLAVAIGLYYLLRPAESVEKAAERVARALADADPGPIQSLAAPGTSDDAARWYETIRPQFVHARERWTGKAEVVEAHLSQQDPTQGKAVVGLSVRPAAANARDVSLAKPEEATAAPIPPFDALTDWVQGRWGRWQLDGTETFARVRPTP